MKINKHLATKI